jgi:hypothetical protein
MFCGECGRAVLVESLVGAGGVTESADGGVPDYYARFAPAATTASDDGGRLLDDAATTADELLCPQCGTIVDDSDVFCGECGFVLKASIPGAARDTGAVDVVVPGETPWPFAQSPALAPESPAEWPAESSAAPEEPPAVPEAAPAASEDPAPPQPPVSESDSQPRKDPIVDNENNTETEVVAPASPRARTIPDPFPWGADIEDGEDVEATRIVSQNGTGERFVLQFSTGESVTVSGAGLIGRNPAAQPGEYVDQLVSIFDVGKSVSKTHLEFGQEGGRFWVSDRYSTNGSIVRQPEAEPRRCEPGRRYFVVRGTRIDVGEQFFVVS